MNNKGDHYPDGNGLPLNYYYDKSNYIASQRVCEKLGMRKEGLFIEFISFVNDQEGNPIYENTIQWAILKKEWDSIG